MVMICKFSTLQALSIAAIQTHMEIAATQAEEESDVSNKLQKDFFINVYYRGKKLDNRA